MKKYTTFTFTCSLIFGLALSINALRAQVSNDSTLLLKYDQGLSMELVNQGSYGIALGGFLGKNIGNKNEQNYALGIYSEVLLANEPIFGPRLKFTWNYLTILGVGVNFANYYRNGTNDFRITPEVNFSLFGVSNLFIGYGFNVNNNPFNDIADFRIGMNINFKSRR